MVVWFVLQRYSQRPFRLIALGVAPNASKIAAREFHEGGSPGRVAVLDDVPTADSFRAQPPSLPELPITRGTTPSDHDEPQGLPEGCDARR